MALLLDTDFTLETSDFASETDITSSLTVDPGVGLTPATIAKNEWMTQFGTTACGDLAISNVVASCTYYSIFDSQAVKYIDFTGDTRAKKISTVKHQCTPGSTLEYNKYGLLPAGQLSLRNTCFPQYTENNSPTLPPRDQNSIPLVEIDQSKQQLYWGNYSDKVASKSWKVNLSEKNDDGTTPGFNVTAKYTSKQIKHKDWKIDS